MLSPEPTSGRLSARYRLFDSIAALTNNVNGFAHGVEQFEMAGHALCRSLCVRLSQPMLWRFSSGSPARLQGQSPL